MRSKHKEVYELQRWLLKNEPHLISFHAYFGQTLNFSADPHIKKNESTKTN